MVKVLLAADLHLGDTTHDPAGEWRRDEAHRVAQAVQQAAMDHGVGMTFILGDLYHTRRPQPWAYEAARLLPRNTVVVSGNHDGNPVGTSPNDIVTNALHEPHAVPVGNTLFVCIPWFSRAHIAARFPELAGQQHHMMMADALRMMVDRFEAQAKAYERAIVLTHMTITGASYNSDVQPTLGESSEFLAPAESLLRPWVSMVFSGHIHKPQAIHDGQIVYVGSAIRHDFGEEQQVCRAIVLDTETLEMVDVELPATPFATVPVDAGSNAESLYRAMWGFPPDAVVRLKGEMPPGAESAAAIAEMESQLTAYSPVRIAKPAITYTRHEMREQSAITTQTPPTEALAEYINVVGGAYEDRRESLLALHAELMEEVTQSV